MSKFTYGGPPAERVKVTSHDGREIEVEAQIVAANPDAYAVKPEKPVKATEKKEA